MLSFYELKTWYHGQETRQFSVEKGVGHILQINLDIVVAMHCADLHINVQDASGDLILAGELLHRDETTWAIWRTVRGIHALDQSSGQRHGGSGGGGGSKNGDLGGAWDYLEEEDHVADVMALTGGGRSGGGTGVGEEGTKSYKKTPKVRAGKSDACRIWGSMELNKVQGDFHITARGHGYLEWGEHLDHSGEFITFFQCLI